MERKNTTTTTNTQQKKYPSNQGVEWENFLMYVCSSVEGKIVCSMVCVCMCISRYYYQKIRVNYIF